MADVIGEDTKLSNVNKSVNGDKELLKLSSNLSLPNPAGDKRCMRRTIAEDPEWSLATIPPLTELIIFKIISDFQQNSEILLELPLKQQRKVLERISTKIPIKITANLIQDELYWKRCCKDRWEICDVVCYDNCYKSMYFERNLQELIENFVPTKTDSTEINKVVSISAPFIKRLTIKQLLPPVKNPKINHDNLSDDDDGSDGGEEIEMDHFEFNAILENLLRLEELSISYSVADCGMNFEWSIFQFTARDCLHLAKAVSACKHLTVFRLTRSKVDDDKVRVLIGNIIDHPGLIELDLSHNQIGDRGARALGKFLNNHSKLKVLNVYDNKIRAPGCQAIAHALTKNTNLLELNLRMNRLGDEGGMAIGRALLRNTTVLKVNLAANELSEPTASVFSQVCLQNIQLKWLDLSCNRLGLDGGKTLKEGLDGNSTLTFLDLRLTDCGEESEYQINNRLEKNREKERLENKDNSKCNSNYIEYN